VRKTLAASMAGLAVAALAACSSSGGGSSNGGLTAKQLGDKAIAAINAATSVEVKGTVNDNGQALNLDMHYGKTGAAGTITVSGQTIQLVAAGSSIYFKAPDAFLKQQLPAADQAALPLIHGKWLKIPATASVAKDFSQLLDRHALLAQLASKAPTAELKMGAAGSVDGVKTITLLSPKDNTTVQVAASGTPYVLEVKGGTSSSGGDLTFSQWNVPFTPSAPTSNVFDASQFVH
jgi:hypothetical protein